MCTSTATSYVLGRESSEREGRQDHETHPGDGRRILSSDRTLIKEESEL
jgi:hypothetical protein